MANPESESEKPKKMEEDSKQESLNSNREDVDSPDTEPRKKKFSDATEPLAQAAEFAKNNKMDAITYVFLFIGAVSYIFDETIGGLLIGGVAGVNFYRALGRALTNANDMIAEVGMIRSAIIGVIFLCLLWSAPFLFIGMAITAVTMKLIMSQQEG